MNQKVEAELLLLSYRCSVYTVDVDSVTEKNIALRKTGTKTILSYIQF